MTLKNMIDRPAAEHDGHSICIGPTQVDLSSLAFEQRFPGREKKLLNKWKADDLKTYTQSLRANYYR